MDKQGRTAEELFGAAFELAPEQRSAFLARACEESPELRRLVDDLLAEHARTRGLADHLATAKSSSSNDSTLLSPPSAGLPGGTTLGRYIILEPLGAGGMGIVYRARDERLERTVAIKILAPGLLTGAEARNSFRKEALALAKLSHPHIAAVYDVGEQDGTDFLVMECIRGETLAARLRNGPLTVKEATSIVQQILSALEEAHEHGVVHRDLKPANVMLTTKVQVKVLDFGLAKLLAAQPGNAATVAAETAMLAGTPPYMSPEQAQGKPVDVRSDLWTLGVIYYELLTGQRPFQGEGTLAVLHAILYDREKPLRELRPEASLRCEQIVSRLLQKNRDLRYATAADVARDLEDVLSEFSAITVPALPAKPRWRWFAASAALLLLVLALGGWWYHGWSRRQWARNEAIPQAQRLLEENRSLAAFLLLQQAQRYLPDDPQLKQMLKADAQIATINSQPSGATIEIADYSATTPEWHSLGATPLANAIVPKGYFRWRILRGGQPPIILAPATGETMNFDLDALANAPKGMIPVPASSDWQDSISFIGWVGPYKLPAYDADQYEVTNRQYQDFVDAGGYEKEQYWLHPFAESGRPLSWSEGIARLHDSSGRPGPATWVAGHYPAAQGDYPVSGVSWYEAEAYAAFASKTLPVLGQWFQLAPPNLGQYIVPASNISTSALAPVGKYPGVGPYGTYDMAGNVREWVANLVDGDRRFILGGAWTSLAYLYSSPEALPPFDRSPENGFRCVRNKAPIPADAAGEIRPVTRDFATFKPATDAVFHAYELLYAYPESAPLNPKLEGVVTETEDWREEKVSFDTAYRGERMNAYLFLPKHVQPPFQTVLFSPSARVVFLAGSDDGRALGDLKFVDYIIQSGRAVMYPIYEGTYERKIKFYLPSASQSIELTIDHYKDAARSLDYLATRPDIDSTRLAYLGVSMGAASGVIAGELLQDRLKTLLLLDGGYFLDPPPAGGDQADFAPRVKIPVLMVNGRYDFTFSLDKAQNPLFRMLGTPEADKRHVVLESPHDVTEQRPQLLQAVLPWLDQYLGRVRMQHSGH
jgi:formylglycine-generating enzyme required for sulfatase activity/predicted Ser/Thr protein kinase